MHIHIYMGCILPILALLRSAACVQRTEILELHPRPDLIISYQYVPASSV
jgi:hypothetical protein